MRAKRKSSVFLVTAITAALLWGEDTSAAAGPPGPTDPDYVPSEREIEAILIAQYRKKIKNDLLYYKGRKLSEIDKALGIKPPASTSKKPGAPAPVTAPLLPLGPCTAAVQPLLIRRDRLDTFQLRDEPLPVSSAKGASLSITRDDLGNTTTAAVNGRVQVILYDLDPLTPCVNGKIGDPYTPIDFSKPHYGFVIAPFVDAQGTETFPVKKTDSSNLQGGADFQMSVFGGPLFDHQYFIATPYYQTDFRGSANVQGFQAGWEPVAPDIRLGGVIGVPDPYVDWYWQFRAAADVKNVTAVGATGLSKGGYDWLGSMVVAHFMFFPGRSATEPSWVSPAPAFLVDRLYANLTLNTFWDSNRSISATWYEVEFGYNITTDGKSSISAKFDGGKNKDTLLETKKYLLSLNYKN